MCRKSLYSTASAIDTKRSRSHAAWKKGGTIAGMYNPGSPRLFVSMTNAQVSKHVDGGGLQYSKQKYRLSDRSSLGQTKQQEY